MNFSSSGNKPFDEQYFTGGTFKENILTVGKCSYAGGVDMRIAGDYYGKHFHHILIGRFVSISHNITFLVGENHSYRGTTSTFPFDDQWRIDTICQNSDVEIVKKSPTNPRMYANHNQIIIGNDVWIGLGATIISGARIESGAIIGAGAVVTKDIPPYAIAVGNPARVTKYRFDEETIKKFMAIKWWNWDIKKILENVPLMKDAEKFLSVHYPANGVRTPSNREGVSQIVKYRTEGRKIYSFVADFRAVHPLWKRVVGGFLKSAEKNSVLVIFLGEDVTQKDFDELKNFVSTIKSYEGKIINIIPPINGEIFSPEILRESTNFITTREFINVECLDWLYDTNVKILSALDDAIFENEPAVEWNEIYK